MSSALAALVVFAAVYSGAAPSGPSDASYGRLRGDLAIAGSAGVALGDHAPRAAGDLRLRYLQSAGVFGSIENTDVATVGIEVRPLFVARWGLGYEWDAPRVDLLVDSLALEVGASFVHPGGRRALQAGLGLEVPLFADATGPFIGVHSGMRWTEDAMAGNGSGAPFVALTVGWQQIFDAHIAEAER